MITIADNIHLKESEFEWQFIRASGSGGQHINKVSTAVQLIFDIQASSLPDYYKQRLQDKTDHRISKSGKIIIKCQQTRSQEMNRELAMQQFIELVLSVAVVQKKRVATKATYGSQQRRLESKKQRGATKALRQTKPRY
ncbi:alternative ribosome rescue aminoacyl-tRNA hydrolase ArfB [Chromatiaceae bacterium AAb-1]|nr:alternative ribosome rescue aminoacyl-tRNA hydrolase ArfB [Chromatiaceae bacterium AAb-1]